MIRIVILFYFFKTNTFTGELKSSKEGKVFWINKKDIKDYIVADGFMDMLEVFENDNLSENYWWLEDGIWKVVNK